MPPSPPTSTYIEILTRQIDISNLCYHLHVDGHLDYFQLPLYFEGKYFPHQFYIGFLSLVNDFLKLLFFPVWSILLRLVLTLY